ncbi:hypothetical protein EYF80_009950 [Liparis tanakae]|uniref:Uncharacterized protein n=1 Tax=Liparis tanakae TaxID=230148 RepID=A0A4Z2IRU2_9TELE|nr:hypothetical protein EYF80_009950 [Liparis tanakae]
MKIKKKMKRKKKMSTWHKDGRGQPIGGLTREFDLSSDIRANAWFKNTGDLCVTKEDLEI